MAAAGLVAAAFFAPLYSGQSATSTGTATTSTGTLVGVNGLWVVLPVSVPLLLALAAWLGLHRRCSMGSSAGTIVAWSAAALLGIASLLAFSIGILVLPISILILLAAALTPLGNAAID
jgi:energy-converting hydrogenase Eha subunit B